MDIGTVIIWLCFIILGLIMLYSTVFSVEQQTVRVVERFGKFLKVAQAGLNFKLPLIDSVSAPFDMKLQQLIVSTETKTKDNVFVQIDVAVQYEPLPAKVYEAYYRLQNPSKQITSYVFDVVRSQVPTLNLDDVFLQKDEIAIAVEKQLETSMTAFGYSVEKALVVDVKPDEKVQAAMNEINAAQRLQVAAQSKAEAEKIVVVKNAEAEAESKALQGKGIADQRKAIIEGLKDSVATMAEATGIEPNEVMNLVLLTQYFDTMKEIGKVGTTIFMPSSPSGMASIGDEIRNAIISGNKVK